MKWETVATSDRCSRKENASETPIFNGPDRKSNPRFAILNGEDFNNCRRCVSYHRQQLDDADFGPTAEKRLTYRLRSPNFCVAGSIAEWAQRYRHSGVKSRLLRLTRHNKRPEIRIAVRKMCGCWTCSLPQSRELEPRIAFLSDGFPATAFDAFEFNDKCFAIELIFANKNGFVTFLTRANTETTLPRLASESAFEIFENQVRWNAGATGECNDYR